MLYYISYKGKKLGSPLSKQEAEHKLLTLSRCLKQLEIVAEQGHQAASPAASGGLGLGSPN